MIRIKGTPYQNTAGLLAAAADIAEYYGFRSFNDFPRTRVSRPLPPGARPDADITYARRDERSLPPAARHLLSSTMQGPLLAWRVQPASAGGALSLELHAVGIASSIAEALLIATAAAIVEEAGIRQPSLAINNVGGLESSARFVRDVSGYLRKHIDSIAVSLRPRTVTDPLGTLVQLVEKGHPAISRAPQPMDYLTEEERRRFWELLEYVEAFGLPYELSGHILGSRDVWAHALFEISGTDALSDERTSVAFGGRYDALMSRLARQEMCATMIAIQVEERGSAALKRRKPIGTRSIYFAHLGPEARRRALPLLETLRRQGLPVYHSLWHERIGEQMAAAAALATPYILIMGHKEAVEGTVLVREVATNSQEAIALPELRAYLKRKHIAAPLVAAQQTC